jgi:hypothetical protein
MPPPRPPEKKAPAERWRLLKAVARVHGSVWRFTLGVGKKVGSVGGFVSLVEACLPSSWLALEDEFRHTVYTLLVLATVSSGLYVSVAWDNRSLHDHINELTEMNSQLRREVTVLRKVLTPVDETLLNQLTGTEVERTAITMLCTFVVTVLQTTPFILFTLFVLYRSVRNTKSWCDLVDARGTGASWSDRVGYSLTVALVVGFTREYSRVLTQIRSRRLLLVYLVGQALRAADGTRSPLVPPHTLRTVYPLRAA